MTRDEALIKAASALETMQKDLDNKQSKLASFEKRERCEKLAFSMIDKGLLSDNVAAFHEKVAGFMKQDDLDSWEKAIEINLGGLDLGESDDREKTAGATGEDQIFALILED